jgi:hypothetical protein
MEQSLQRSDNAAVKSKVAQYLLLNQEIADRKTAQENLKRELEPYLRAADTNARGSHVIPFKEVLEVNGKRYGSLQKTKKVSKVLNEDKVIEWAYTTLNGKDIERLVVTVQHVDQDVLWDLFVNEELTQEELDSFFDETVSWSFNPTKE